MIAALEFRDVAKSFTLHLRGGTVLPVVAGASFSVAPGECAVLWGPSGTGKSSLLRMAYGNYRCDAGAILVRDGERVVDVARAAPRDVLALRARTMSYVSQFLRVIPRVSSRDVVEAAGREGGLSGGTEARSARAISWPGSTCRALWGLPPATFSGGEQQRVNIAKGLIAPRPILLLDEPTASLDAQNRAVVAELVEERRAAGGADPRNRPRRAMREAIGGRIIDVTHFGAAQAA